MEEVYVLGGLRTPIVVKNNRFKNIRPEHFGAVVLRAILDEYALSAVDGILGGNAVGTGGNITRLMALEAGLDETIPACTIDMQCASAAAAIDLAYAKIACGAGEIFLAGGMESSSLQPVRFYDSKDDRYAATGDGYYKTAQFAPDELSPQTMLEGAERVARAEQMTAAELSFWAIESHHRACETEKNAQLRDLIVPIAGWRKDDGIHPHMSQRLINRLPPSLGEGTLINAANACRINDGAAFVALCSGAFCRKHHLQPKYRLVDTLASGGDPSESPRGAMRTADLLLMRHGLHYEDMAAIEFNEAFAVIDVLFARRFPELIERYNAFGGALAYGHPYGASGAILALHLMKAMQLREESYGIASIAGAGGMGAAFLLKVCK